jgi:hypothetical protein
MAITPIVTVNTSITTAPIPNQLQQRGALISQGGTTLPAGTSATLSSPADLAAITALPVVNTSLTWASSVVTVVTAAAHGWTTGDAISVKISGATPIGYNGTFLATVVNATTFTYPLVSNPGAGVGAGSSTLFDVTQLTQMASTYFSGNGVRAVDVLELGEGTAIEGVAALTTFLTATAGTPAAYYAYLVPREWDGVAQFLALANAYTAPSKQVYFFVTTTLANRAVYSGPAYKNVFALVESPSVADSEFSCAAPFSTTLKQNPSTSNKVPPLSYTPAFGATPYPVRGNQTVLGQLAAANANWIGTGAEGGITTSILFQGKMSDGNFWNFWYSVDWAQINMDLALANEVINGAASSINPLYYNQQGVDRLQARAARVAQQGISYGLGNGQVILTKLPGDVFRINLSAGLYNGKIVINAEPFSVYTRANPSDYGAGKYAGLSAVWIPQLPFLNVFFNLQATTLITG